MARIEKGGMHYILACISKRLLSPHFQLLKAFVQAKFPRDGNKD
jgi:hypothetical protein